MKQIEYQSEQEEKTKAIKFCLDELKLTNKQKGGFRTRNPSCEAKTLPLLVEELFKHFGELKQSDYFVGHYNMISASNPTDPIEALNKCKDWLHSILKNALAEKRRIISNVSTSEGYFDYQYEEVQELPQSTNFNDIDRDVFGCIMYCKADGYVYVRFGGKLLPIGSLTALKKDITLNDFDLIMKEQIRAYVNPSEYEKGSDNVLVLFNRAKDEANRLLNKVYCQIQSLLDNEGKKIEISDWNANAYDENMNKLAAEDVPVEVVNVQPSRFAKVGEDDYANKVSRNIAAELFIQRCPMTLIALGYVKLFYRYKITRFQSDSGDKAETLKALDGLHWRFTQKGTALTDDFWVSEVVKNVTGLIKDNILEEAPRTYSDDPNQFAILHSDINKLRQYVNKHKCFSKLEDCKALCTLKSWMSEFEFKAVMAWCYSAIFPTKAPSEIALFLHTGGGTGKSTLYRIIEFAIEALTGENRSMFSQRLLGSAFDKDDFNIRNPEGEVGICKAAIINIDEATTTSLEMFKDFSGTPGGNKITGRKVYSTATSDISYAKWMFTSNKPIELTSDDGSYQRRISVIEHPEVNNLINIDGKTASELDEALRKEVLILIQIGKDSYEELTKEGKSLDDVLMHNEELAANLKKSVGTEANEDVWNCMKDMIKTQIDPFKDERRVGISRINKFYEDAAKITGNDERYVASFKKWLKTKFNYKTCLNVSFIDLNGSAAISNKAMKCFVFKDEDLE